MSEKSLTILFAPLDGWGHINACIGLAEVLLNRGHRVVFAIDISFKGKLKAYGFEEEIHFLSTNDEDFWANFARQRAPALLLDPIGCAKHFNLLGDYKMFEHIQQRDPQYIEIINRVKPNVIVVDNYVCSPILTNSGIPWVWLFSAAPHMAFKDDRIPPAWSGFPLKSDKKEWKAFTDKLNEMYIGFQKEVNDYCVSKGAPKLEDHRITPISPYLNIYLYPKELDYEELQPMPKNWIRVENFIRITNDKFEVPEALSKRPGKLIFLSMGSFGCGNIDLMIRLTNILSKSEHKFIVSKGLLFESHELPDNMWGQKFLPQTAVLPLVDLVITHGGNNTVTETFYFGKPMLVLPLFADQYDNAQRVTETGLGLRLSPFHCSETELLSAVERLVSDKALADRMTAIGQRIRNSNDKKIVSNLIENICV